MTFPVPVVSTKVSPPPIMLAGGGGGAMKPGRYVKSKDAPLANLFLSMADAMGGTRLASHGDSTGRFA
jgi:hypothetical protein